MLQLRRVRCHYATPKGASSSNIYFYHVLTLHTIRDETNGLPSDTLQEKISTYPKIADYVSKLRLPEGKS
jgi:hypothetical protein